ncbi:MAG: hypothetical protein HYZ81_23930 [Nitrospinae bacterium]|nr:hypothetical protein [Nitrospinota bacterium]
MKSFEWPVNLQRWEAEAFLSDLAVHGMQPPQHFLARVAQQAGDEPTGRQLRHADMVPTLTRHLAVPLANPCPQRSGGEDIEGGMAVRRPALAMVVPG